MSVQAIGSTLSTANSATPSSASISEQNFIQLFVSELQFQDPMEPLDNSQFLTQLSQFVGIEQQSEEVTGINNLLTLGASEQPLDLLSHTVEIANADGSTTTGTVTGVQYSTNGAQLTVTASGNNVLTNVNLSQIQVVSP
ncbi:flagellar hook capping FlgD N-terminal domain-containing protein [Dyella sp. S184]|jgi:flagellar basal-body rod modification protein FlgD|uniref:flagellar hook capping FlgD N-terminal domain-containing protein n=1 Tax=Dyella sp. S184 TaxID=1641862 RepID=UPI00131BC8DF|nr:flagellar hook capping FlgD N-terminal domain-containing protein [Dyella sp. S184]